MKKCLRITITAQFPSDYLQSYVQTSAKKLGLEGTAQLVDDKLKTVRINVCGTGDALEEFIDIFHKGSPKFKLADIEIVPFLKDKDYRNVFRIIE